MGNIKHNRKFKFIVFVIILNDKLFREGFFFLYGKHRVEDRMLER